MKLLQKFDTTLFLRHSVYRRIYFKTTNVSVIGESKRHLTCKHLTCVLPWRVRKTRYWDVLWVTTVVRSPSCMCTLCKISLISTALNVVQPDLSAHTWIRVANVLTVVSVCIYQIG